MICMVRHGQTDQNKLMKIQGQSNFHLNETGINQAIKCGEFLKSHYKFDMIITSPLWRAKESAEIIKGVLGDDLRIIEDNRFIERAFGESEGKDICIEVFKDIYNDNVCGLEKSYDLQNRICDALVDLFLNYPNKNILIVSHSHAIKGAITKLNSTLDFTIKLENCCLNIFDYDNGLKLVDYNISTIK